MEKLRIGDKVLVGSNKYQRVYSFGHRDELAQADFIHLLPSGLEISGEHMLFVRGKGFIPARTVLIGDKMENGEVIENIHTVRRQGVYTPYTPSGTIVVNGVLASNYIAFQDSGELTLGGFKTTFTFQWLDHAFQMPHRVWCHWLGMGDKILESGFSSWSEGPFRVGVWFMQQHPLAMAICLVPLILLLMMFSTIEMLLTHPIACGTAMASLTLWYCRSNKNISQWDKFKGIF